MQVFEIFISAGITILSIGLFILSILGYKKRRNSKMILISLVFFIFFIKGLLFSYTTFIEEQTIFSSNPSIWIFDLIILILFYLTSLKG